MGARSTARFDVPAVAAHATTGATASAMGANDATEVNVACSVPGVGRARCTVTGATMSSVGAVAAVLLPVTVESATSAVGSVSTPDGTIETTVGALTRQGSVGCLEKL